jgi:hypothetical protein
MKHTRAAMNEEYGTDRLSSLVRIANKAGTWTYMSVVQC